MAQDEQDDATRAFESLRAEVIVMRRAVEALEAKKPKDYSPTLGEITKRLEGMETVITVLGNRPALRLTPESYDAQLRRITDEAKRPIGAELQRAQTLVAQLDRTLGEVRTREQQRTWMLRAVAVGLVAGPLVWALLLLPLARALPDRWHVPEKLAAGVIGADRWNAGQQIAESTGPEAWGRLVRAARLEEANREALADCERDAAKTGRSQRCTVQVSSPSRPAPVPVAGQERP